MMRPWVSLAETRKGRPNTRVVRTKLAPLGRPARRISGAPPKKIFLINRAGLADPPPLSLRKAVQLKPIGPKRGGRADTQRAWRAARYPKSCARDSRRPVAGRHGLTP